MTLKEFKSNLRGQDHDNQDFPSEFLTQLFNDIAQNPIEWKEALKEKKDQSADFDINELENNMITSSIIDSSYPPTIQEFVRNAQHRYTNSMAQHRHYAKCPATLLDLDQIFFLESWLNFGESLLKIGYETDSQDEMIAVIMALRDSVMIAKKFQMEEAFEQLSEFMMELHQISEIFLALEQEKVPILTYGRLKMHTEKRHTYKRKRNRSTSKKINLHTTELSIDVYILLVQSALYVDVIDSGMKRAFYTIPLNETDTILSTYKHAFAKSGQNDERIEELDAISFVVDTSGKRYILITNTEREKKKWFQHINSQLIGRASVVGT